jgi:hypothetical protein
MGPQPAGHPLALRTPLEEVADDEGRLGTGKLRAQEALELAFGGVVRGHRLRKDSLFKSNEPQHGGQTRRGCSSSVPKKKNHP